MFAAILTAVMLTATPLPYADDDDEAEDPQEEPGSEEDMVERDPLQKYFPLTFPDDLLPFTDDVKWNFLIITAAASFVGLPLAQLWVPLFLWDTKPKVDWDTVLKPYLLQVFLPEVIGHVVLVALCCAVPIWIVPIYGWAAWWILFVWSVVLLHVPWEWFNIWRGGIASLQVWDNALRAQGLADDANADLRKQPPPKRKRKPLPDDDDE